MSDKIVTKEQLFDALKKMSGDQTIYAPIKEGEFHTFTKLETGLEPDFSFQNTRLSPKELIQPPSERMFQYTLDPDDDEANILKEVERDYAPWTIVGIRPCDAKAIQLVKINFDTQEYQDPFWLKRYEAATFIGLACGAPCASCFCSTTGSGPFHEEGLDALLVDLDQSFLIKPLSEKGEAFLKAVGANTDASAGDAEKAAKLKTQAEEAIVSKVPTDKLRDQNLNDLFNAPFWEDVSFSCINCGTCTYLCPTCWCFDIQDEVNGVNGLRIRNWDACMFPLFTLHGSGHNPRDHKLQRVRQRFMHKLKYYVDKYDNGVACVGCGRCVQFCPVNIDIRKVFQLMNEYEAS